MRYLNGTLALFLVLAITYKQVAEISAIRMNIGEEPAKAAEAAPAKPAEAGKEEALPKAKVKKGDPSESEIAESERVSPFCVLEGKKCRDAVGMKPLDTSDDDLLPPKGMSRSTPPAPPSGSEAEKPSKGEPKELKKNSTVHVEMIKMIPNKAKLARIAERKRREEEEKKKKEEEKKKKEEEAKAKAAAQKAIA